MTRMRIGAAEVNFQLSGPEDAPFLVLAHPLGADLSVFDEVAAALSDRLQILAVDARGHGGGFKPPGPYALSDLGGDLLRLMDALAIERAHFCGLSMGGLTGQWLLVHAPHRLEKLILANTAAHLPDPAAWDGRIAAVEQGGVAALTPAILPRWLSAPFRAAHPDVAQRIAALLDGCDAGGYAGCCAALRDADFRDTLAGAAKKDILVIVGESDGSTPPPMGEDLAALSGARLARLNAAHLSCVEDAPGFAALLRDFLI
jgi:3-oxoadipate enol-lactonase